MPSVTAINWLKSRVNELILISYLIDFYQIYNIIDYLFTAFAHMLKIRIIDCGRHFKHVHVDK
jgi:hypothetical protein